MAEHAVGVDTIGKGELFGKVGGFRGRCRTCKWKGPPRIDKSTARGDYIMHVIDEERRR